MNMKSYISDLLSKVLQQMRAGEETPAAKNFDITIPKENLGDYSTNAAFVLAKELKQKPQDLAEKLAKALLKADKQEQSMFATVHEASGFVNIFIDPLVLAKTLTAFQKQIPLEQLGRGKKIVFEYSSPNTNKPLHIGHTRNDVFGKACINLLRASGYEVLSCEVINDRGIHIMKSMLMYMLHGKGQTPEQAEMKPDHFVGKFYAMFAEEVAKDPTLDEKAQELLQKWEANDPETKKLWEKMNDWFYRGVAETYKHEGSTFDFINHESEIYAHGKEIVRAGVSKGVFIEEEDGSVSVDLTDRGLDKKYLLRKDGTSIYITQDIYLWSLRAKEFNPNQQIVTTSAEQTYHFKVLKEIFLLLGYEWADNFKHLPYEHVYLGKNKMSSRAGNAVSADDLLKEVKQRVRATMLDSQKIKGSVDDDALVESVAFAAIKYGYLKYDSNTKIYFDLEETVAIEGNTGPYIQYAHARIKNILMKSADAEFAEPAGEQQAFESTGGIELLKEPAEIALARFAMHYPEAVLTATNEYKPSILCAYIYELAAKFSTMYDQVSVLQAESEELKQARLHLLMIVAEIIEHGLELLGINAPDTL
jgi:arginyl-tRNA synthetase